MSSADKKKLDEIAEKANNYTLPTASNTTKGGVKIGKNLTMEGETLNATDTTYSDFIKSGSGAKSGLVPAPSTTAGTTKYLREDGTWAVPPDTNTTYSDATQSASGLMSAEDKKKLDNVVQVYVGTEEPSESLGKDGDIYIMKNIS